MALVRIRKIFRMPVLALGIIITIISGAVAYLFENFQQVYYCTQTSDCHFFGGGFWYFLLFNLLLLILVSFLIRTQKGTTLLKIICLLIIAVYIFGIYEASRTYAMVTSNSIVLNNHIKLTIAPENKLGNFDLPLSDVEYMTRRWHLRTTNLIRCVHVSNLTMKNGQSFSIDDFGVAPLSFEMYLINILKIPVLNTSEAPTIKCP